MGWAKRNVSNIFLNTYFMKRKTIYIFIKSHKITPILLNKWIYIHNGKKFFRRYVFKKYLGYLAGELVWTRKPAKYKKKKLKTRKRSKKTERKQTKNPSKIRKKKLFKIRRKKLKLEKKKKLIELNPLLKPKKASQKLVPDTVFKILKLFK